MPRYRRHTRRGLCRTRPSRPCISTPSISNRPSASTFSCHRSCRLSNSRTMLSSFSCTRFESKPSTFALSMYGAETAQPALRSGARRLSSADPSPGSATSSKSMMLPSVSWQTHSAHDQPIGMPRYDGQM